MTDGIYRFVLRKKPDNDGSPKLMGVPRTGKRQMLEDRFDREREFQTLKLMVQDVSKQVRRLIPAMIVRAVPQLHCDGAKVVCELYSENYSVHNERMFSAIEVRNLPHVRKQLISMLASVLNTIARQLEYDVSG